MRDGIDLIGKKVTIEEIEYKVSNLILVSGPDTFHIELESKKNGLLNLPIKKFQQIISEHILKNGKKHLSS